MDYEYHYSIYLELPELHRAARDGARAKVKKLLDSANPDARGKYKDTPLMWAACGGNRNIVADLLKAGADVKAIDANKSTPLLHAAESGRDEIVADLLAAGAVAKAVDILGMTALHLSAFADAPMSIATLIASGVAPNRKNEDGNTALHIAAQFGHPAAIRALVKGGADVNFADKDFGLTALHLAAEKDAATSILALADYGANLDAKDHQGDTAMHKAAQAGYMRSVQTLFDVGAKVNLLNEENQTPLLLAQQAGHTNVADTLILADKSIKSTNLPESEYIAQQIYDGAWRRIVAIAIYNGAEMIDAGSGVIIAPNVVATNLHVVNVGRGSIAVFKAEETRAGMPFRKAKERRINKEVPYRSEVFAESHRQDFCLLEVPGLGGEEIQVRASSTLRVGEDVYALGNPMGVDLTLSAGVISQLRDNGIHHCREIQTNAATSPGSSGGGLFDKDGNLVGITTGVVSKKKGDPRVPQNLNFAIPADLIWGHSSNLPKQKPATKSKKGGKR